uniref:Low affinity vacuolar monovalent cation/H(+) antiporter-like n=1 Tax=Saccoglossus kowalevskii TaxID=10224 RepID=A0ABM0LWT7_SACKO|nr:PREDICTED: low affinity vacuolar monovalent cation/H(+) antiporter-like [Saccoglossus kowalevskii]
MTTTSNPALQLFAEDAEEETFAESTSVPQDVEPANLQDDDGSVNNGTAVTVLSLPRQRTYSAGTPLTRDSMVDGFVILGKPPENEIEAQRISQNYMFGFKKWKSHLTPRPLSERSDVVKELYAEPKAVKPFVASTISIGNVLYCLLFGWWIALVYLVVAFVMLITIIGKPHAVFCAKFAGYFFWPFGKFVQEHTEYAGVLSFNSSYDSNSSSMTELPDENTPLNISSSQAKTDFVKKDNNLLSFVILALLLGYIDHEDQVSSETTKFVLSLLAIIPLAYYIGMAVTSIAAQSNFAVGAILNATFGSIVEITLYVSALIHGHTNDNHCYSELVKSALTGTILATLLFIPGLCMILGGIKHHEQAFNWRSAGVTASLLFVCIAGAFAPTIFSKAYGVLICSGCTEMANHTIFDNDTEFICSRCTSQRFDQSNELFTEHIQPLIYTCTALLPLAYIVGLIFTLKTHTHIHKIEVKKDGHGHGHGIAHWSRTKSFFILLISTVLMSLCAELVTENIQPLLEKSGVSLYFIGVTLLALVPDIPEIVNGIQFALQNNMTLSIEVGCSIAVQVCLLQMPVLVIVNAIYYIDFILIFNDLHLWSVVLSVVLVNYTFMDGKCDYFQGSTLVIVYLMLVAMYFFAPNPPGCS